MSALKKAMGAASVSAAALMLTVSCGVSEGPSLVGSATGGGGGGGTSNPCPNGGGGATLTTGIENGKYSVYQSFDVQRSPSFPTANVSFTVSSFNIPYSDSSGFRYTMVDGEYITFFIVDGGTITQNGKTGCNIGIVWHKLDGSTTLIATGGTVWGLSSTGFFHNSLAHGYGTYVSANLGHSNGDSVTYTPAGDIASCADLAGYIVNTEPLGNGESAPACNP